MYEGLDLDALRFGLAVCRVGAWVAVAPMPWESAPKQIKVALVLVSGALCLPVVPELDASWLHPLKMVGGVTGELLIGLGLGFAVRCGLAAAEILGGALAPVIGFGAAQVFDPASGVSDSVLVRVYRTFCMFLVSALGVHRVLLGAVLASYRALPIGSPVQLSAGAELALHWSALALETGVRLAFPITAILILIQVALAFVSRAAPSMQVFSIGFAITLSVGGFAMLLMMPDVARELGQELEQLTWQMDEFILAIGRR